MKHAFIIALTMTTTAYGIDSQSLFQEPTTPLVSLTSSLPMDAFTPLTPDDVLADGQDSLTVGDGIIVRKGTVKATMENVKRLNDLLRFPYNPEREKKVNQILDVMDSLIPPLHYIGLFDFFSPLEWMQNEDDQGKILIAILYLKQYKNQLTLPLERRLLDLKLKGQPEVRAHIEDLYKHTS